MKIYNYFFNRSLSIQVFSLLGIYFLYFVVGIGLLFYFQHKIQDEYIQQREKIEDKQQIINYIYDQFQSNILVRTDSLTFKVPENRKLALNQENELRYQIAELNTLIVTRGGKVTLSGYRQLYNLLFYRGTSAHNE